MQKQIGDAEERREFPELREKKRRLDVLDALIARAERAYKKREAEKCLSIILRGKNR